MTGWGILHKKKAETLSHLFETFIPMWDPLIVFPEEITVRKTIHFWTRSLVLLETSFVIIFRTMQAVVGWDVFWVIRQSWQKVSCSLAVFVTKFNHNSVIVAETALRFKALVVIIVFLIFPTILFLLLILTVRLVIEADGCLDWEVSQQCFAITVQVVIWLGFWPEQSVVEKQKIWINI